MALSTITRVPKQTAAHYFADGGKQLGPVALYACDIGESPDPIPLAGTVDATASATVTGTGTSFTTELTVDAFVEIDTLAPLRVKAINSDTEIELYTPITVAGANAARVHLYNLGETDATKLNFKHGKAELKSSQKGASPDDRVLNAYETMVQAGFVTMDAEAMSRVTQGIKNSLDATTGAIKGQGWGVPIGERDSDVAFKLFLVRINGFAESTDPKDTITLYKVATTVDTEISNDAENQITYALTFNAYIDEDTLMGGVPLVWSVGDIT